ncbi:type VI secretion system-associated protein TagF [Derxia gummosa]|uniref:Type VI secretion system-associated protein TagF n=1 Tax=Derxia gummosa DSM 723 TaxID=1121388 RepID=A0A8B6X8X4_9BURK|nr:type VI secretion system-associated protein TagF [Derxia gummosa]
MPVGAVNPAADTPGWYGKLPSLGDFASRRLPPGFLDAWDAWLAAGLDGLKRARPESWLAEYLDAPAWRFLLMPGCVDGGAWAGVLLPSVDRVGRYFPLTLAAPLTVPPLTAEALDALLAWLHRAEDTAQDALQEDWGPDALEAGLAMLGPPPAGEAARAAARPGLAAARAAPVGRGELVALVGASIVVAGLDGFARHSFWHAAPDSAFAPTLMLAPGLPAETEFSRLFTPLPALSGAESRS